MSATPQSGIGTSTRRIRLILLALIVSLAACTPTAEDSNTKSDMAELSFDWQGHRGCRGLLPENSLNAFIHALDFPAITTLEMDVVIAADGEVVVSHEPWISEVICAYPNGDPVPAGKKDSLNIYRMSYPEVRRFDCGSRGNPRFSEQQRMPAVKPRLHEILNNVRYYCDQQQRPLPHFNIELKARPEWDDIFTPPPAEFVERVLDVLRDFGVPEHIILQSFDARILREIHQRAPNIRLSWLSETPENLSGEIKSLGFTPEIYSPYHAVLSPQIITDAHGRGMLVIPWTVNETTRMEELIEWGVDGIITDYPNRIPARQDTN